MSIENEIYRLQGAKEGIRWALNDKGVTVPMGETLDAYAGYVEQIPTGGGMDFDTLKDIIPDNTLYLRITYYPNAEDYAYCGTYRYGCEPVVTDNDKAVAFLKSALPEHSMGDEQMLVFYYNKDTGIWTVNNEQTWEEEEFTEAELISEVGVTPNREAGYGYQIQLSLCLDVRFFNNEKRTYDIKSDDDLNTFWQGWGDERTFDGATINVKGVCGIKFGLKYPTNPYWCPYYMNFPSLVEMGSIPAELNRGRYVYQEVDIKAPRLNCPLVLFGEGGGGDDEGDGAEIFGGLAKYSEDFNSNIYFPEIGHCYSAPHFGYKPKMTGKIYWGENVSFDYGFGDNNLYGNSADDPIYTKGVTFCGPGAWQAQGYFPDLNGPTRYRKVNVEE